MQATFSPPTADVKHGGSGHPAIADLVERTERVEGLTPLAIMAFFIGMPLAMGLLKGHPILAIINAVLLGLIGIVIVRIVSAVILTPMRSVRYRRAAHTLDAALALRAPTATVRRSWSDVAPGALAIIPAGHVLLVDRSTEFATVRLDVTQIAGVDIVTDASVQMTERRRPGLMLALPLGGLIGGLTVAGRATTIARIAETHALALRYQLAANGPVRTSLIPFGQDRDGAASLKLAIDRLRSPLVT